MRGLGGIVMAPTGNKTDCGTFLLRITMAGLASIGLHVSPSLAQGADAKSANASRPIQQLAGPDGRMRPVSRVPAHSRGNLVSAPGPDSHHRPLSSAAPKRDSHNLPPLVPGPEGRMMVDLPPSPLASQIALPALVVGPGGDQRPMLPLARPPGVNTIVAPLP